MQQGWIKLHRKLLENPFVMKDAEFFSLWIYLLLHATHDNYSVVFKGQKRILNPGQMITGRKKMAEDLHINESKVYRILKVYESEQQIEIETSNKKSIITICHWNEYQKFEQQNEQQINNCKTNSERLLNTNNNVNNVKNGRKLFIPPTTEEVKKYCTERKNDVNAERFVDFYEAKGWMLGKNRMKDWKAAVRTWEKNSDGKNSTEYKQKCKEQREEYTNFGL